MVLSHTFKDMRKEIVEMFGFRFNNGIYVCFSCNCVYNGSVFNHMRDCWWMGQLLNLFTKTK